MSVAYVALPKAPKNWATDDYVEPPLSMQVLETEAAPVRTGLLDAHGTPIYRVETRAPMGFRS